MGSPITGYRVWYNNNGTTYVVLADNVQSLSFNATQLTKGLTYYFFVQAKNALGYG